MGKRAGIRYKIENFSKIRYYSLTPRKENADVAQLVEHVHGKDEVIGSIPIIGSSFKRE